MARCDPICPICRVDMEGTKESWWSFTPGRAVRWTNRILKAVSVIGPKTGLILGQGGVLLEPGGPGKTTGLIVGGYTGAKLGFLYGSRVHPLYGSIVGVVVGGIGGGIIGSNVLGTFDSPEESNLY